jgi:hypothetical protein
MQWRGLLKECHDDLERGGRLHTNSGFLSRVSGLLVDSSIMHARMVMPVEVSLCRSVFCPYNKPEPFPIDV